MYKKSALMNNKIFVCNIIIIKSNNKIIRYTVLIKVIFLLSGENDNVPKFKDITNMTFGLNI